MGTEQVGLGSPEQAAPPEQKRPPSPSVFQRPTLLSPRCQLCGAVWCHPSSIGDTDKPVLPSFFKSCGFTRANFMVQSPAVT